MNTFNKHKWSGEFLATFGAYDVENHDLFISINGPQYGSVVITEPTTTVPALKDCPLIRHVR
jgi:hypothetical protein